MNEIDIFLAALNISSPAERASYLIEACAGNSELQRRVDLLLAAHHRDGKFLDEPALQQIEATIASNQRSPDDKRVGHDDAVGEIKLSFLQPSTQPGSLGRLGHYEVLEIIGRGGFGIVLKAFDDLLHRPVAIKVMAPAIAVTSPARKRFLREARAAAAIRHENVISIHAVEDQPIPFLVMEYIAGPTLQQKLDGNGPLDVKEVVQIGLQIAGGLEAAHAMGIVHRDIKPGNILLEHGRDRVKITDFGLARAGDDASLTQSGVVSGTPLYMSPEQAQGDTVDARSDLFSLGSVLYVMCSGRPPFRAGTTLAVLNRVVKDQPRPIREIIPDVPEWLTSLIEKLHAKNPEDRITSASEVMRQLAHFEKHLLQPDGGGLIVDQVPAVPKPETSPRRKWLAGAGVLLLLAGLVLSEAAGVTNLNHLMKRQKATDGINGEKLVSQETAQPAVAWPFAKHANSGKLVFHDKFDDPKTSTLFQGTRRGSRYTIENGIYSLHDTSGEVGPNYFTNIGLPVLDHVFTLRMKSDQAVVRVSFRHHNTPTRGNWLFVRINPNGKWTLERNTMTLQDGKRTDHSVTLSESAAPDPTLAAGRWLTIAARTSGHSYELWLNGQSVAQGSDEPTIYNEPNSIPYALQVAAWPVAGGLARVDLDDIAIWDLSAPSP